MDAQQLTLFDVNDFTSYLKLNPTDYRNLVRSTYVKKSLFPRLWISIEEYFPIIFLEKQFGKFEVLSRITPEIYE